MSLHNNVSREVEIALAKHKAGELVYVGESREGNSLEEDRDIDNEIYNAIFKFEMTNGNIIMLSQGFAYARGVIKRLPRERHEKPDDTATFRFGKKIKI